MEYIKRLAHNARLELANQRNQVLLRTRLTCSCKFDSVPNVIILISLISPKD